MEWQVAGNTTVAVNYLFVKGDQLQRATDINIGPASPIALTDVSTGQVFQHYRFAAGPFTNFSRIIAFQSTAESRYNGLTLEVNRRLAGHLQGRVAYTLGKVTDTVPDATAVVANSSDDVKFASNPTNFEADRARGNNDQRHRLVLSAVYDTNGVAGSRTGGARMLITGWSALTRRLVSADSARRLRRREVASPPRCSGYLVARGEDLADPGVTSNAKRSAGILLPGWSSA